MSIPRNTAPLLLALALASGRAAGQAGDHWPRDPNATRLFFGPTARSHSAAEGSVGVFELIMPYASYGVTSAISVSGGLTVVPGDHFGELAHIGSKVRVLQRPGMDVAVGGFAVFGIEEVDATGIAYVLGTLGTPDAAVTAGAAVPFYRDGAEGDFGSRLLVMAGGERRVSRRLKLLTENYLDVGEASGVVTGGIRILGPRLTADVGLGAVLGDTGCCAPLLNVTYAFGRR